MKSVNTLLEELCPDGVAFMTISSFSKIFAGGTPKTTHSEYYTDGTIPWLCSGEVDFNSISSSQKNITQLGLDNSSAKWIKKQSVLVAMTGATAAKCATLEINATANQSVCAIEPDPEVMNYRFLYYLLESKYYDLRKMSQGAMSSINLNMIKGFIVPVPPLVIQNEIVRLIEELNDSNKKVISVLNAEYDLRVKQYKYYSHALFTAFRGDNIKKLGDVVDICMCKRIKKDQTSSKGDVPFYQNGTLGKTAKLYISYDLFEEYSKKYRYPEPGDVLLSTVGTIGRTLQFDGKPAYFQDSNIVWFKRKDNSILNDYLYWFCISMPWKISDRATLNHLHNYMIVDTEIAVPSIDEQRYIIEKFNILFAESEKMQTLLQRDIDRHQKQYEFYRDKLLSFNRLK
ncbi:type I restriction enzyme, S subunit [Lachnospiraceae bacterium A10]|nr:type I restriction enzyme, S subunit [Lachnospiraceae bacterium A10]